MILDIKGVKKLVKDNKDVYIAIACCDTISQLTKHVKKLCKLNCNITFDFDDTTTVIDAMIIKLPTSMEERLRIAQYVYEIMRPTTISNNENTCKLDWVNTDQVLLWWD